MSLHTYASPQSLSGLLARAPGTRVQSFATASHAEVKLTTRQTRWQCPQHGVTHYSVSVTREYNAIASSASIFPMTAAAYEHVQSVVGNNMRQCNSCHDLQVSHKASTLACYATPDRHTHICMHTWPLTRPVWMRPLAPCLTGGGVTVPLRSIDHGTRNTSLPSPTSGHGRELYDDDHGAHNCGPWCVWLGLQWLRYHELDTDCTFSSFFQAHSIHNGQPLLPVQLEMSHLVVAVVMIHSLS